MTQILRVPETAGFEAIRSRLAQVDAQQIALDLPDGWLELDNAARMRLLQRQAQIQGKDLAIISRHEPTRKAAKAVGVPVFLHADAAAKGNWSMDPALPSVNVAQPEASLPEPPPWRRSDIYRRAARPTQYRARQQRIRAEERYRKPAPVWVGIGVNVAMGAMIAGALLLFALYVLPAATITLSPGRERVTVNLPLTANADLAASELEDNLLAARLVETSIVETGAIQTSGSRQKATENAVGAVTFTNLSTTAVTIPQGTVVSTSSGTPVSFRTTQDSELPGGVGSQVSVPVEALEPGIQGNVRANTINTVSGPLRFRARVINPQGTGGGGASLTRIVTAEDQEQLLTDLKARVEDQALAALQAEVEAGEWLSPDSVQTYVIAQVFDQYQDSEADELGLTLRVLVQGVAVAESEMQEATLNALENAIPEEGRLVADTITFQRNPGATASGRTVDFAITAAGDYVVPVDPQEVRSAVTGMTSEEAGQMLEERWLLNGPPEIYQDPAWISALPRFPSRIQVRLEYADALANQPAQ